MAVSATLKTPKVKTWDKMSMMERRVALAQDVLDRLATNKYRAKQAHGYLTIARKWLRGNFTRQGEVNPEIQLQTVLQELPTCTVCAKGGFFAAHIERNNEFKLCALTPNTDVERVDDQGLTSTNDQAIEQLKDAFDQKCLDLIESAFEGTTTYNCGYYDGANRAAAEMYGESIGAKERLTRICNNIISNGGAFVIPNVGSF